MAKRAKKYAATITRDEAGWWVATVHGIAGVHTQGRTLERMRERIREALAAARPGAVLRNGRHTVEPRGFAAKGSSSRASAPRSRTRRHKSS